MNVVISNRTVENCGIDTYAKCLIKGLPKFDDINIYRFEDRKLTGYSKQHSLYDKIMYFPRKIYRDKWVLPRYIETNSADIFHCTECYGIPNDLRCKIILTLHDIIPAYMENNFIKRYMWKRRVKDAINKADAVVTVSNYSKRDIVNYFDINQNNVHVIYEYADEDFKPIKEEECFKKIKRKYSLNKPYILLIGGKDLRKNHERIVNIFKERFIDKYQLVILGGGYSFGVDDGSIIYPGYVSRADLVALYSNACLFVYPSLYEGFGLPVLEAMACGTPVVTSNTTSIPEVAGDSAILVNPIDDNEIALGMESVLESNDLRDKLIYLGMRRNEQFSKENMLKKYHQLYKDILNINH